MRLSAAIGLLLIIEATCSTRQTNSVGTATVPNAFVEFSGTEWLGNVQCVFNNEVDCALSIHTNGRRIDGTTHKPNEDVYTSCITARTSIALVIHSFTFADVLDYTCLEDATKEVSSKWLNAIPIIEASGSFIHGQPASLTCNAPPGSPLFWVLPGPSGNHQAAAIIDTSNAVNASRTVTFTLNNTDHFATYRCCIGSQAGQPPQDCTTYTVVDSDSNSTSLTTENYRTLLFKMTASVHSVFEMDPHTLFWESCYYVGNCYPLDPSVYNVDDDPENHHLSSQLTIVDDSFENIYILSFNATNNQADYTLMFNVLRGYYYPLITQEPTFVYYKPDDGSITVILKFTINANPQPTFSWSMQQIHGESKGTEPLPTGGRYTTKITQVTSTSWDATLTIANYDITLDNAIYTFYAENIHGANWIDADTSVGPSTLNLARTSNLTLSFACDFQTFPNPPIYEISVAAPYDTNYTVVSQTLDPQSSKTTVNVDVGLDIRNTYFHISCTASNSFNSSLSLTNTLTVLV